MFFAYPPRYPFEVVRWIALVQCTKAVVSREKTIGHRFFYSVFNASTVANLRTSRANPQDVVAKIVGLLHVALRRFVTGSDR